MRGLGPKLSLLLWRLATLCISSRLALGQDCSAISFAFEPGLLTQGCEGSHGTSWHPVEDPLIGPSPDRGSAIGRSLLHECRDLWLDRKSYSCSHLRYHPRSEPSVKDGSCTQCGAESQTACTAATCASGYHAFDTTAALMAPTDLLKVS